MSSKVLYIAKPTPPVAGKMAPRAVRTAIWTSGFRPWSARIGTNPEQLFAAGWSACFESAIAVVARKRKIVLPGDVAIDAEVDLKPWDDGYSLTTRLNVSLRGSSAKPPRP